jgi:hypothetical protein
MKRPNNIMFDKQTGELVNSLRDAITGHNFPRVMAALNFTLARCVKCSMGLGISDQAIDDAVEIIASQFRDGINYLEANPTLTMGAKLIVVNEDEVKR